MFAEKQETESASSRKVYNLAPQQRILDNYDITASGGVNRYD